MVRGGLLYAGNRWVAMVAALGLLVGLFPAESVANEEAPRRLMAWEVASRDARDFGSARPVGIAYDSDREEFVVASRGSAGVVVARISPLWDRVGAATLPDVTNPSTLVYDQNAGALRSVDGDSVTSVESSALSGRTTGEETPLRGTDLGGASSAAHDPQTTSMLVLDSGTVHLVASDGNVDGRLELPRLDDDVLIARNPADGNLYVLDPEAERLDAYDSEGHAVTSHDMSNPDLISPEAMVFAPSTDRTDEPETHNLFIADSGDETSAGGVTEVTLAATETVTAAAVESATLVNGVDTSAWSPPSTDPSGVAWNLSRQELIVVDSEVNETGHFQNVNLWHVTPFGDVLRTGATDGPLSAGSYSDEPTGVGYDNETNTMFISDDTGTRSIYVVKAGGDGELGTSDDLVTQIDVGEVGASDAEEPEYDPNTGHLFFLSGSDQEVFRIDPGPDGQLGTTDDSFSSFDISFLPSGDFEGLTSSQSRNTLFVGSRNTDQIWEITKDGSTVIREIQVDVGQDFISGLALAPSTDDPAQFSLYFVDRGEDEDNDGMMFEIRVPNLDEPAGNRAPSVDAGGDETIAYPDDAPLDGTVTDDGLPEDGDLTSAWSKLSGPGTVTFADASSPSTTASFSEPGVYELELSASDGELDSSDRVTITVEAPDDDDPPEENDPPEEDPPSDDPTQYDPTEDDPTEDQPSDDPMDPEVKSDADWFSDDDGHLFEDDINAIAAAGITRGCNPPENTLFCPDDRVTRGQMAAFLVRALGYTDGGGDHFVDDDGHVFEGDIDRLAAAGVTRGCNPPENDRFCPDENLTRGQTAAFLVRALGYTDDAGGDLFVDDDGSMFEADIDRLAAAGVAFGCNPPQNDRYCPDEPLTRGQMAAFLNRALLSGG